MKNYILILLISVFWSCANSPGQSTHQKSVNTVSPEAQARELTNKMKDSLTLNDDQENKILMINVVNLKIIKRLRETNETDKLSSTKEKYRSEIKEVLTEVQYNKFLVDFKDL